MMYGKSGDRVMYNVGTSSCLPSPLPISTAINARATFADQQSQLLARIFLDLFTKYIYEIHQQNISEIHQEKISEIHKKYLDLFTKKIYI